MSRSSGPQPSADSTKPTAHFAASLPHPVGLNRTYRSGRQGWYMTPEATSWQQLAVLRLRQAGFRGQPEGAYWVRLDFVLYTIALDVDAPLKLAVDAVSHALSIDDRWVGELHVTKVLVRHRPEQRLALWAQIRPVADKEEWQKLSEQRSSSRVTYGIRKSQDAGRKEDAEDAGQAAHSSQPAAQDPVDGLGEGGILGTDAGRLSI